MVLPNGPRLTELRDERGWTNPQVARKVRCSRQLVWRTLNGGPTGEATLGRFAKVFRVDAAEITLADDARPDTALTSRNEALQRTG
jgi:transcriptional regulator with XRE-family HTH domain